VGKTQGRKSGKHPGGRPTKYRKSHGAKVESAAESHAPLTDEDIADLFGVSEQTVKNWYKQYPEFLASVKRAKAVSDDKVERSLFERATGYSVPDVHITGKGTKIPIIKHYPPDVVACIFWLKNRRGEQWRDKQELTVDARSLADIAAVMRGAGDGGGKDSE